jgi:hypothetical protein
MRRIKISFILIFGIIVAIVGIGIVIPEIYFSEAYSEVNVDQDWTPINTNAPTQTIAASSTPTLQTRLVTAVSPTPTIEVNCVYPLQYWEDHPELWLDLLVGDKVYTKQEIHLIFDHPTPNIYQTLLKQIYLSNLNIYSGADPKTIQDVLRNANQWLQENTPDNQLSEVILSVGGQIAQTLAAFNTGVIGPGYCSPYETLTETPLVILSPTSISSPTATATATATRVIVTARPTATATQEKDSDNKPNPTNPPKPTQEPDTPVPPPTNPPPPTDPPPEPTDPPPKPTPTPAS